MAEQRVKFSNFTTLPSGEMEADIEVSEEFRQEIFEKLSLTEGDEDDEEKYIGFISSCFQELLHRIEHRKDPDAFVNKMLDKMREHGDLE